MKPKLSPNFPQMVKKPPTYHRNGRFLLNNELAISRPSVLDLENLLVILQDLHVPRRLFDRTGHSNMLQCIFGVRYAIARDIHNIVGVLKDAQTLCTLLVKGVVAADGKALL